MGGIVGDKGHIGGTGRGSIGRGLRTIEERERIWNKGERWRRDFL